MKQKKIIVITGPTSVGKSKLSLKIAQLCNGAIINCDSRQVYREIPIITDQPNPHDLDLLEHKLYGYIPVIDRYSIQEWIIDASENINSVFLNNKTPFLVGGTGMYVNSLINGLSYIPKISNEIRSFSVDLLDKIGNNLFYKELENVDPESASKISIGDSYRMLRAFEVIKQTGKSIIHWRSVNKKYIFDEIHVFALMLDTETTKKNINNRFDDMVCKGVIKEVEEFMKITNYKVLQSFTSSGLSEISEYIKGNSTIDDAISSAKIKTIQYAKRQRTWFRNKLNEKQLYDNQEEIADNIYKILKINN